VVTERAVKVMVAIRRDESASPAPAELYRASAGSCHTRLQFDFSTVTHLPTIPVILFWQSPSNRAFSRGSRLEYHRRVPFPLTEFRRTGAHGTDDGGRHAAQRVGQILMKLACSISP